MHKDSLSVILPTYNERGNIVPLIEEIKRRLQDTDHEVIVIDDNSPDGTCQAVRDARLRGVRTILRTENKGLAQSIRCGIEHSRGDVLVVMDSDFNHQPRYISELIAGTSQHDCISASRYVGAGRMNSRFRHFASGVFNRFINLTTGGTVKDNLYGFFAIRRKVLFKLSFDDIFIGYGDYYIRLLYALQKRRASIHEISAINGKRRKGQGNRRFLQTFFQYLNTVLQLAAM